MTFKAKGRREELKSYIWFHAFCFAFFHSLFLSADRGVLPWAGDCHGNRLQGGDLQQRFMMDGGGVGEESRGSQEENEAAVWIAVRSLSCRFLLELCAAFISQKDGFLNWFLHLSRSQQLLNHSFLRGFLFCRLLFKSSLYRDADLFSVKSDLASVHYFMLYK